MTQEKLDVSDKIDIALSLITFAFGLSLFLAIAVNFNKEEDLLYLLMGGLFMVASLKSRPKIIIQK